MTLKLQVYFFKIRDRPLPQGESLEFTEQMPVESRKLQKPSPKWQTRVNGA